MAEVVIELSENVGGVFGAAEKEMMVYWVKWTARNFGRIE